jgi:hypothetical protein
LATAAGPGRGHALAAWPVRLRVRLTDGDEELEAELLVDLETPAATGRVAWFQTSTASRTSESSTTIGVRPARDGERRR